MSQRYLNGTGVDTVLLVDATSGNETVNLPRNFAVGRKFTVRRLDGSVNTVTVDPYAGESIDGVADATASVTANAEATFTPLETGAWVSFGLEGTAADATALAGQSAFTSVYAPKASPTFTGNPTAPTPSAADSDTSIATTAFVQGELTAKAPLASPTFTGVPAGPTAAPGTNTTQVATTAFSAAAVAVETARATAAEALKADLASPALTGTPTAPTPTAGDNDTSIATTAFVTTAIGTAAAAVVGVQIDTSSTETLIGAHTISAGSVQAGTTYRVEATGTLDNVNPSGTVTVRMRLGGLAGTVVGQVIFPTAAAVGSSRAWRFIGTLTFRTAGAAATWATGAIGWGGPGTTVGTIPNANKAGTTVDTTVALDLAFTGQWATSDAGNVLRTETLVFELVKP